ncbi:MAG: hypothetical protein JNM26_17480 [Ideonella sp.]|nr:hypothetical protein [Ideonella sp.]
MTATRLINTTTARVTALALAAAAAAFTALPVAAQLQLQLQPEVLRGKLPADLAATLRAPVQVATCPAPFREVFANERLSCEKRIIQRADVQCPAAFPNFTARNVSVGTDRDLCAKAGVVITSDGNLNNFRNGVDYVFVPANGVRNGVSFVAGHPDATPTDGWAINDSNVDRSGIIDRYQRTLTLRKTPILVNP